MTTKNTDTPLIADCPSATCSASWFLNGAEYRKRNGYIEARNNLNPDWVVVDKDESSDSMPNTTESRREFEEWALDKVTSLTIDEIDGEYFWVETQLAWEAWQAARKRQWLPIESAPKDTPILASDQFGVTSVVYWRDVSSSHLPRYAWSSHYDNEYMHHVEAFPTYWMPLHNPPTNPNEL